MQYPEVIFRHLVSVSPDTNTRTQKILARLPEKMIRRIHFYQDSMAKLTTRFLQDLKEKKITIPEVRYVENTPEEVQVGKPFSDFSGETPDGQQVCLAEVVKNNKLVLLDFWASWCGPCMQGMPYLVGLYKKYKEKGLEIIGISSDENAERWTRAIEKNDMTWRSAGEDRIGRVYSVKFIPYTILIDHNGKIIARRSEPEELEQFIKEALE